MPHPPWEAVWHGEEGPIWDSGSGSYSLLPPTGCVLSGKPKCLPSSHAKMEGTVQPTLRQAQAEGGLSWAAGVKTYNQPGVHL